MSTRLHVDKQLIQIVAVTVMVFGIFFYGIYLGASEENANNFVGETGDNIESANYTYEDHEPENASGVVEVEGTNKTIGTKIEVPAITVPAGKFEWYNIFDADFGLTSADKVAEFSLWPETTIWSGTTFDMTANTDWYEFELNFQQFGNSVFPVVQGDYDKMQNYLEPAPWIFSAVLAILPTTLVLKILSTVEVGY